MDWIGELLSRITAQVVECWFGMIFSLLWVLSSKYGKVVNQLLLSQYEIWDVNIFKIYYVYCWKMIVRSIMPSVPSLQFHVCTLWWRGSIQTYFKMFQTKYASRVESDSILYFQYLLLICPFSAILLHGFVVAFLACYFLCIHFGVIWFLSCILSPKDTVEVMGFMDMFHLLIMLLVTWYCFLHTE